MYQTISYPHLLYLEAIFVRFELHFLRQLDMNFVVRVSSFNTYLSDPRYPFKLRNAGCIPAEGGCYIPVGPCTCVNLPLGRHDAKIVREKTLANGSKSRKQNKAVEFMAAKIWRHTSKTLKFETCSEASWKVAGQS